MARPDPLLVLERKAIIITDSGIPLDKQILRLKLPVRRKIVARAMKKSLQPVGRLAIALAPNETGSIRDNIRVHVRGARKRNEPGFFTDSKYQMPVASVGVMYKNRKVDHARYEKKNGRWLPWYAHFVEGGTINFPAKPFVRLAFELLQEKVKRRFAGSIFLDLRKQVKRKR